MTFRPHQIGPIGLQADAGQAGKRLAFQERKQSRLPAGYMPSRISAAIV